MGSESKKQFLVYLFTFTESQDTSQLAVFAITKKIFETFFTHSSKQFVTVSRDTKAYVWKLEEGKREFELFYTGPNGDESEDAFRIRACRYDYVE